MKATSMQRKGRAGAQGSDGDNVEENFLLGLWSWVVNGNGAVDLMTE